MEAAKKDRLTLRKKEKLRHKTLVDGVFSSGETLYEYPLRVSYRILKEGELEEAFRDRVPERIGPLQMLVTVPKKKLRHAVDRVRMRRLIREAYRLNRLDLQRAVAERGEIGTVSMAFIYLQGGLTDYATIEKKMRRLLKKIASRCGSAEEAL